MNIPILRNRFEVGLRFKLGEREMSIVKRLPEATFQLQDVVTEQLSAMTETELIDRLFDGNLEIVYYTGQMKLAEQKALQQRINDLSLLPENIKEETKRRRVYITALQEKREKDRMPLTKENIDAVVGEVAKIVNDKARPFWTTVCRWYGRWKRAGGNVCALVPRYQQRGANGYLRVSADPAKRQESELGVLIQQVIEDKYLTPEKWTVKAVHDYLKVRIDEINRERAPERHLKVPCVNTLHAAIARLDQYEVVKAREGQTKADLLFKPVGKGPVATRPLERVELDHTKLDLILVDEESRLPIGRPWLTVAIDKATRMICGFYIGFSPPSAYTVLACLRHAIGPKGYIKELFPRLLHSWDVYGMIEVLVVDNGMDLHSEDFQDACLMTGTVIQYAPPRVPQYKGPIERWFKTHNTQLVHLQPGTTFSDIFERDEYVPEECAVISLTTFNELLHIYIVDIYHEQLHRGLMDIPARAWERLVEKFPPALPPNRETLDVWLGYTEEKTPGKKGIQLHNLFYNCEALGMLRRTLTEKKVKIKYDPSDLSRIYVADPTRGSFISVPAVDSVYTQNLTLWQHNIIWRFAKKMAQGAVDEEKLLEARRQIQRIVEEEYLTHKKITHKQKLARYRNVAAQTSVAETGIALPPETPKLTTEAPWSGISDVGDEYSSPGDASTISILTSSATNAPSDLEMEPVEEELDLTGWQTRLLA